MKTIDRGRKLIQMTAEEKAWMQEVYELRKKDFFYAGFFRCLYFCVLKICFLTFLVAYFHDRFTEHLDWLRSSWFMAHLLLVAVVIIASWLSLAWITNQYLILPYKQDAEEGKKEERRFLITEKKYYPVTGQYFLELDNAPMKHIEVDEDTYNSLNEGDDFVVYRGVNSQYIFELNDHVKVKFFWIGSTSGKYGYPG